MHHVAIMKPSWKLIPKILSGEKTIESRWYQTRRAPWNTISVGDTVYFKNAGEPVVATAVVSAVEQCEIASLADAESIMRTYGREICLVNDRPSTWGILPKYCVLIHLVHPEIIEKPFHINKKGFGGPVAWMTVGDIGEITV